MAESIIQTDKECLFCGTTQGLEKHHILKAANRVHSETYGLWVWLCGYHHREAPEAPHRNRKTDLALICLAQTEFERQGMGDREEFMAIFGKNYLDD